MLYFLAGIGTGLLIAAAVIAISFLVIGYKFDLNSDA
jgi:hypothetical protein